MNDEKDEFREEQSSVPEEKQESSAGKEKAAASNDLNGGSAPNNGAVPTPPPVYPQQSAWSYNGQQPVYPPRPDAWNGSYGQMPPANGQNEWNFHEYGPLPRAVPNNPGMPPKMKKPKAAKKRKEKKETSPARGYKIFAVVISILFVASVAGFSGYIASHQQAWSAGSSSNDAVVSQAPSGETVQKNEDGTLTNNSIYRTVEPAVVGIVGYARTTIGVQAASQGSGVIFSANGYIVTNNHVITDDDTDQPYNKVEVILSSGKKYDAVIKGRDKQTDLAVLKISATGLKPASFGDSDKVVVGDKAIVIGNPNGVAFAGSFTEGTISAVHRRIQIQSLGQKVEYIQTDAAINPGNSGGALVNAKGELIGITSAKVVNESYEGMGFAIPINNVKPIINSLISNGWVRGRVQIGITYIPVSDTIAQLNGIPRGLRVVSIESDSDAIKKGLQKGDIITKIDGKQVFDADTVASALSGKKPKEEVTLTVYRVDENNKARTFDIKVVLSEKAAS